jgi:hypothetical protein
MACAARSIVRGSLLALALAGLLSACSFSRDGVKDPVAGDEPDAADEPTADSGAPVLPQGMSADAAVPADAATAPEAAPPEPRPGSGPPGWQGGPLVVAVGQGGRRVHSANGVDWTGDVRDVPGDRDPSKDLRAIGYAGGLVVAVGGGCTGAQCAGRLVTFDGARWSEVPLPAERGWLSAVAHGGGVWVAAGAAGAALVSSDGKRWSARGTLPANVRALVHGNVGGTAMFIAVGDNGLRARSTDGQSWTSVVQGFPGADDPVSLRAVAIGNGTVVTAGEQGRRIRSRNGSDWTDPAAGGNDLASLVYADQTFLAYADNGIVFLSPDDGRSWNPQVLVDPPRHSVTTGMMSGSRLFVAARGEIIMTSSNGLAWSTRFDGGIDVNTLNAFVFAGY